VALASVARAEGRSLPTPNISPQALSQARSFCGQTGSWTAINWLSGLFTFTSKNLRSEDFGCLSARSTNAASKSAYDFLPWIKANGSSIGRSVPEASRRWRSRDDVPRLSESQLPKCKLLEEFGQSTLHDWAGRTKSESDLKKRIAAQFRDAQKQQWPKDFTLWGGWKSKKLG
jgi:hypothetical protein